MTNTLSMMRVEHETTVVKTEVLQRLLDLSKSILEGNYSQRIAADFEDNMITKIVDNLNRFCDKVQLNPSGLAYSQDQTVSTFIEVISSFTNLDFTQKLPISENGTIMDAIATGINILGDELEQSTASKKDLERERNKLDEAQSIARIGSWELRAPSFQLKCSKEAFRIFEVSTDTDLDLYEAYMQRVHPDDIERVDKHIRSSIDKVEDFTLEHRIISTDGSMKYILCIGEVVKNDRGHAKRWKGTFQDITDRKSVEEKLRNAKTQAEEASKAKSRFLANMSHEIRTPLNGILGLAEIMMGENVSNEHYQYLKLIRESGKNLAKLINDILDFSKIESGNLQLENIGFNFSETITASILPYKFLAEQKGLNLVYNLDNAIPSEVIGDPTRISQIVTNLVGNAIKFTEHGKVDVSFSLKETKQDELIIQGVVKDTGVGIPKGVEQRIFQSFSQADETITRKFGGTGLGLSIVRSLLQQMSGDIVVQSPAYPEENMGSAFIFTLRLKKPAVKAGAEDLAVLKPKKFSEEKALHILIVDDNKINLLVADRMIKKFGAEVTTAESGAEAIELAASNSFDLVLMDIQMPDLNGCETAIELRKAGFDKPIIALSANAYAEDIRSSIDAGMNDHLQKPYTENQLFTKLKDYVRVE
ncbi:hypothetical protein WSM22_36770 [Cytophagales bacterium WSM2-2]|nr:hypothetical protein WSM22_36770 [Cytophagales bacterium WSM2-2]